MSSSQLLKLTTLTEQIVKVGNRQREIKAVIQQLGEISSENEMSKLVDLHNKLIDQKVTLINKFYSLSQNNVRILQRKAS